MGLTRYLDLVRTPGAARVMAAAAVGRLPYGMLVLALILLLRAEGFSYAETGLVTGHPAWRWAPPRRSWAGSSTASGRRA
jgi:hypothetical protein